jgi:cholesterol transport system auxiliary component
MSFRRRLRSVSTTALLASSLVTVIAGCSLQPPAAPTPVVFDFGLLSAMPPLDAPSGAPTVGPIGAPPWLDGPAMLYRLAYGDGARLASYRDSRWAAPPAALLYERLRQRLARSTATAGASTLRIELEEFCQVFDAPASSHAVVRVRAAVVEYGTGRVMRQRAFTEEVPSATPDAPGGARALVQASDTILARVLAWAAAGG